MFTRTACSGLFHTPARLHPSYFAVASRKRRCQKKRRKTSLWFWHYFQFPRTKGACARTWTCSAVRAAGHASPAAHACEPDVRVLCTPAGLTAATRWACTRLFAATVATELRSLRPRPSPSPSPPSNRRRRANRRISSWCPCAGDGPHPMRAYARAPVPLSSRVCMGASAPRFSGGLVVVMSSLSGPALTELPPSALRWVPRGSFF